MQLDSRHGGFTLIETMVTSMIIAMMSAMAWVGVWHVTGTANEVLCVNNLKTVGRAMETYFLNWGQYPPDYPEADLQAALGPQVDDDIEVFTCPVQPTFEQTDRMRIVDGYSEFYIEKPIAEAIPGMINMVTTCPHHQAGSTTLLTTGSVERAIVGEVLHSGSGGLAPGQIAVGGQMTFVDGTVVDFGAQQCANMILSVDRALGSEGIHNSTDHIIRLLPTEIGEFTAEVPAGSRLGILTCVAVIRIVASSETLVVNLSTGFGRDQGPTSRSGPYTLCINPVSGQGRVDVRVSGHAELDGENPVLVGTTTYVVDTFPDRLQGGRCTPPPPPGD